uniref:Diuretic hormone receptor n=1 Tax=Schistocephalus solidus TaxID=70667 RepID=A0A0V0J849_SCHSO
MEVLENNTFSSSIADFSAINALCQRLYQNATHSLINEGIKIFCPSIYDGVMCWPPAKPNTIVNFPCPDSFEGATYNSQSNATRRCLANGVWVNRTEYDNCIWTNTTTPDRDETIYLQTIYCVGYSISLISLLVSLFIFFRFRTLHCLRNFIHTHLMGTLVLRVIAWMTLYGNTSSVGNSTVYLYNATTAIQSLASLAMICWMFLEGLHLLKIVYWTYGLHRIRIWHYAVFGWGLPAVLIVAWAIFNAVQFPDDMWIQHSQEFYFISLPSLIILCCNVIVLVFILYALICRIKRTPHEPQTSVTNSVSMPRTPIFTNGTFLPILRPQSTFLPDKCPGVNVCNNPADRTSNPQGAPLHHNGNAVCFEGAEPVEAVVGTNLPLEPLRGVTWQPHSTQSLKISGIDDERLKSDTDTRRKMSRTHSEASSNDLRMTDRRKSSVISSRSSQKLRFRLANKFSRSEPMKSLKACLMLIPLLGIPQVVFIVPYHPSVREVFNYINAILISTQGFWVALIYCFLNEEVSCCLRFFFVSYLCTAESLLVLWHCICLLPSLGAPRPEKNPK